MTSGFGGPASFGSPSAFGQEFFDRLLADRHHDLHDRVGEFLDPEAGLRDAMLSAGHAGILGDLDNRLDTEAGLTAIVQPPDPPQQGSGMAAAVVDGDPAVRIALRRHPVILAVILSDLLARSLAIVNKRDRDRDREINRALARAHDIAFPLDREIARDIADARACIFTRDIARDITHALSRAIDMDRLPDRAYGNVMNRAYDEARALNRTRDRDRDRDRDMDRALAHSRDVQRALKRALTDTDVRDLYEAGRAINRAAFPYSIPFITPVTATVPLDLVLARDIAHRVALVVGRRLGVRQVEGLVEALLAGALDEFTHADLSHADLTGLDLTGVRWSDPGTQWPPGTDVDALRARSRSPAKGIYVIVAPGIEDPENVNLVRTP